MPARISAEDIIRVLRESEAFVKAPEDLNLNILRPFIPQLIECVHRVERESGTQVDSLQISDVAIQFTQALLDGKYLQDVEEDFRRRHGFTADFLQKTGVRRPAPYTNALKRLQQAHHAAKRGHAKWLKEEGLTEQQYMLNEAMRLNNKAKQLYSTGQLTLSRLLAVQPDALLPEPHYLFPWNDSI
ncbi:MAG TPA: hypothetical protein VJ841_01440 [Candidatus Saccharimonadales bacterium]|nr:hypothetical protein [Candidatus Saccharimonadales bacterium]